MISTTTIHTHTHTPPRPTHRAARARDRAKRGKQRRPEKTKMPTSNVKSLAADEILHSFSEEESLNLSRAEKAVVTDRTVREGGGEGSLHLSRFTIVLMA